MKTLTKKHKWVCEYKHNYNDNHTKYCERCNIPAYDSRYATCREDYLAIKPNRDQFSAPIKPPVGHIL